MRNLITLGLSAAVLCSLPLLAVTPRFWQVTSGDDFLAGEADGVIITARGELLPGPGVKKLASFTDPFVLSQTRDASGARYFGTGNSGRVYRLRGDETKVLYTAPEPEVYAVAYANGSLFVGSSPNGKIYRVDPDSGAATPFFDPNEAFIWTIIPLANGDLAVGTGVDGKLYRVDRNGTGKLLYDAPETHIRSLALATGDRLIAGGSGEGRIYEVSLNGSGRALFDSPLTEIASVYWDAETNTGWAAGVANYLPTTAPAKQEPQKQQPAASTSTTTTATASADASTASSDNVSVSISFEDPAAAAAAATPSGGSEIYKISNDGFVDTVRRFDREVVYALSGSASGGITLGTGPSGRVYQLRQSELSILATVPEKQVVTIDRRGGAYEITTTNAGAVYAIAPQSSGRGEFRSAVKDTERFSSFGHYEVRGEGVGRGVTMAFRTGNTNTPDETWSEWKPAGGAEGKVTAPAARYVQWRLVFDGAATNARVDDVQVAYVNRNSAPVIDAVTVLEPAAVIVSNAYPTSPQVLEATNPDEYGIFTSLDAPRTNDPGKKLFRRGYRTVSWKAHDDNNDTLRYSLYFRRKGATEWLRLRERMEETQMNFDTSQLPDGTYELRLVVTDEPDNPLTPLTDVREGTDFVVDNTPPVVNTARGGEGITVRITDKISPVGKVEYSIDAKQWTRLVPVDGLADSRDETYRIPATEAGRSFVVVRAVDSFFNVTTANANAE